MEGEECAEEQSCRFSQGRGENGSSISRRLDIMGTRRAGTMMRKRSGAINMCNVQVGYCRRRRPGRQFRNPSGQKGKTDGI
jgi:hypothetical protein